MKTVSPKPTQNHTEKKLCNESLITTFLMSHKPWKKKKQHMWNDFISSNNKITEIENHELPDHIPINHKVTRKKMLVVVKMLVQLTESNGWVGYIMLY